MREFTGKTASERFVETGTSRTAETCHPANQGTSSRQTKFFDNLFGVGVLRSTHAGLLQTGLVKNRALRVQERHKHNLRTDGGQVTVRKEGGIHSSRFIVTPCVLSPGA